MEINNLKQLYDFLENNYQINKNGHQFDSIINTIRKKYKKNNLKDVCTWEQWFLDFMLVEGTVKPKLTYSKEDGSFFEYPSFKTFASETYKYLENRANQVANIHLKARYFHLLVGSNNLKYRHQNYSKNAIDLYLKIIQDKKVKDFEHIAFTVVQNVLYLCYNIDYKVTDIENKLETLIINNQLSPWLFRNLVEILLRYKTSKTSNLSGILHHGEIKCDEFIDNLKKNDLHSAIDFINTKISIADRLRKDSTQSLVQKGIFWEELAGQRNDFIANDFQYEAIKCYNKAGEKKLKELATIKYTQYKRRLVLHSVHSKFSDKNLNELIELLDKNAMIIAKQDSDYIYTFLSFSDDIIYSLNSENTKNDKSFIDFSKPVTFDINNNISGKITKPFSIRISSEYHHFISLLYIRLIFQKGVLSGKINYETLIDFFKTKSWLGQQIPAKDLDGNNYNYTWIGLLAPSILDFFFQYPHTLRSKYHHANYLLSIDSLSIKFEGVLRDIAYFNKVQTDVYDQVNDRMRERYIEEFLNDDKIISLLGKKDTDFLKYIFTKEGLNLRNNIAHCYLNFNNYNADKFLLLITAFLRLGKFKIKFNND